MDSVTNPLVELSSTDSETSVEKQQVMANVKNMDSGVASSVELINTPVGPPDDEQDIFEQVTMILRKRRGCVPEDSLSHNGLDLDLLDDDDDDELVEEDDAGCPLPSTPEDTQLIEAEVRLPTYVCE